MIYTESLQVNLESEILLKEWSTNSIRKRKVIKKKLMKHSLPSFTRVPRFFLNIQRLGVPLESWEKNNVSNLLNLNELF